MPIIYREEVRKKILSKLSKLSTEQKAYFEENQHGYFNCIENSSAKINEKPIRSLYHPYVLSSFEFQWIKTKAEKLWGILEKTGQLLLTDKEVADFFDFSSEFEELLLIDPGYEIKIPITRFDAFYNGKGKLKFCEFNTDGTSGMNETNTMEECFLSTDLGRTLQNTYSLEKCELRKSLLDTLLKGYNSFANNLDSKKPNIAIVDLLDKATIAEFEALKDVFIHEGYKTIIADPRDLTFHDGKLWAGNFRIDLVYRRAVTTELFESYGAVQDFIRAYKENAFCMVGSLRSEAAHSKLVFTFLTSPTAKNYFSKEEITFIKEHIPYTIKLNSKDESLIEPILSEKDNYIIKPHNAYGSQGLYMGKDCSQREWEQLVKDNMDKNYIAQELINIPTEPFITSSGEIKQLKVNLSPFLYGGELKGFYTRVSDIEIITTSRGGALIPTFIVKQH